MRHRIRAVFAVGFFFCGLIATRSAAAATVTVTPDLIQGTFWEGSGATGTITFTVNNGTAATVELFLIVITPAGSGDAFLDKVDFGPSDASNCRNNSSRLAPGASCTIISPYTVLDKDPNDTMNPVDDTGVFTDHVDVAYGPVGGPVTAHAVSAPDSVITVSDVPEPSTLLLCTCGMLGLVSGMRRR